MVICIVLIIVTINFMMVSKVSLEEKQIVMKLKEGVLGRPMHLGQLYDRRTDKILMGGNLINENKLPPGCRMLIEPINKVSDKYSVDSSFQKSGDLLDISGELTIKFTAGPVQADLSGAFGYIKDNKKSTRTSRLTVTKKIRTMSKSLDIGCLKYLATSDVFDKLRKQSTHIVSNVAYGATIIFNFEEDTKSGNETDRMAGFLRGGISIGGEINASASVNLTMDTRHTEVTKNVRIKFHGDVFLPVNPVSIDHAMQVLQTVNAALGEELPAKEEKKRTKRQEDEEADEAKVKPRAVPILATLTPLQDLESKEAHMARELDKGFIAKALTVFDEINMAKRIGNDILRDATIHGFFPAKKIIYEIKDMIFAYETGMRGRFAREIELIRKWEHENRDLIEFVWRPHTISPFRMNALGYFVEDVLKHCQILKEPSKWLLEAEKPTEPAREAIQIIRYMIIYEYLLVYKNHEMTSDQPFVNSLNEYLQNDTNEYNNEKNKMSEEDEGDESRRKRSNDDLESYRRHYFNRSRSALAVRMVNFLLINKQTSNIGSLYFTKDIEFDNSQEKPYPAIYLYEKARLIDDDYQIPTKPTNVTCILRTHDSLDLVWNHSLLGSGNVINYEVSYFLKEDNMMLDTILTADNFTKIENLNPNVMIAVNISPIALPGRCETSNDIQCSTRPSSEPSEPTFVASGESSIIIGWIAPAIISPTAEFLHYEIQYLEDDGKGINPIKQTHVENINQRIVKGNISYLTPKIPYKFRIVAMFKKDKSLPGKWSPSFYAGLECDIGWKKSFDGMACYFFSRNSSTARKIDAAHMDCESRGSVWSSSHVVSIFDTNELYAVQELCRMGKNSYVPIWIGMSFNSEENVWMWNTNPQFERTKNKSNLLVRSELIAYFSTESAYKNPGDKKCVYMGSDLQFHTSYCGRDSVNTHYVCKKKLEPPGCKKKGT